MNKQEFMRKLECLLWDLPESERVEALKYYEEYFSDAGEENEQKVLEELGAPERVADTIKEGLRANTDGGDKAAGMSPETAGANAGMGPGMAGTNAAMDPGTAGANAAMGSGMAGANTGMGPGMAGANAAMNPGMTGANAGMAPGTAGKETGMSAGRIVLMVLLSPFALAAACLLFGMVAALAGIGVGFAVTGAACILAALVVIGAGIGQLFVMPFAGSVLIGTGFLIIATAILLIMLSVFLFGFAVPRTCRGSVWLCRKPFEKKGGQR